MKPFSYHSPRTVDEAIALLDQYQESCAVLAGGTDVIIELNEGHRAPEHVIAIEKLSELRYVKVEEGLVKLGALCTFNDLENNEYVREHLSALYDTAVYVGSPQIRNLGTIGGNVVNASVAGDSPTTLTTYGASVVLKSAKGERVMTLEDFNKGPGNCAIRPDELLTEVCFPVLSENEAAGYFKIGKRKSLAIVVLAVSIYVKRDAENKIEDCRVVLGAVSKHPMRATELENALKGRPLTDLKLDELLPQFTDTVQAAIGSRPSVVYKREAVRGAARRCFEQILSQFALA